MTRTLILHPGTEKTGSTSLQRVLHQNRETLQNNGILVPASFGKVSHNLLFAALQDDDVFDNVKLMELARNKSSANQLRKHIRRSFEQDLENNPGTSKIIFTSELIHSRMFRASSIKKIAEYFSGIVDEVKVIVFLRRQDRLAVSRFSTVLKDGHTGFDDTFADLGARSYVNTPKDKIPNDFLHYYDYEHLLRRFINQFGRQSVCPIVYKEDRCDTVAEFFRAAEIPIHMIKNSDMGTSRNRALSAKAQYLICRFNKLVDVLDRTNNARRDIAKLYVRISSENPGERRSYPKEEARNFYAKFHMSNDWVRKNFFPDQDSLFDNNFAFYPEKVDPAEPQSELLDAAVDHYVSVANSARKTPMSRIKKKFFEIFSTGQKK